MPKVKNIKSPFKVFQEFLSPKVCDDILSKVIVTKPDHDKNGMPMKTERLNDYGETIISEKLKSIIPEIDDHFILNCIGLERVLFQYFPEGKQTPAEEPRCQNAFYSRRKWVKIKDIDLTAVVWLKDYQNNTPIDLSYEVYGGKMEFPAYNFGLVPQRGTLVVYPAGPHFISTIAPVLVGDLYQARINIRCRADAKKDSMWLYSPDKFQGDYIEWFKEFV